MMCISICAGVSLNNQSFKYMVNVLTGFFISICPSYQFSDDIFAKHFKVIYLVATLKH